MLRGRTGEQDRITGLVRQAYAGTSAALVLRGDPGIGKTALLDWAAGLATASPPYPDPAGPPLTVLRGGGAELEADLPFAGLSQLLRPALTRLDRLPGPQREALAAAFGLAAGSRPDRLLIGLAVLSLLAEVAEDGPLLCLVDDAHWLDTVSAEALLFAARRLRAEGIVMIFAARDGGFPAPGLPECALAGLAPAEAAGLLPADLDPAVRLRVLAEARGNPLALIELPRVLPPGEPAGVAGSAAPDPAAGSLPLTDRLLAAFAGQVDRLPPRTRTVLLVAATEPAGDLTVLLGAAAALGAGPADLRAAEEARLVEVTGQRVRFRHPLVRAAVYRAAALAERLGTHRALAGVLTAPETADRRAWHLAAAATGPAEPVAEALEATADQARDRAGYRAASSAYERAAQLSERPPDRARRLLLAAESGLQAGDPGGAVRLAELAAELVPEPAFLARVAGVEGQAWFWQGGHRTAYELLTGGAELDPDRRPALLVAAFHPAWYLGEPYLGDILDRLAAVDHPVAAFEVAALRGRPAALAPTAALAGPHPADQVQLCGLGFVAGQDGETYRLAAALVARCRADGILGLLPTLLFFQAEAELFAGRHRDAAVSLDEAVRVAEDGGQPLWVSQLQSVRALLAALAGDERRCRDLVGRALAAGEPDTEAAGRPWTEWALGLLDLGYGRVEAALTRLAGLQENPYAHLVCARRSVPDLAEAAVRAGRPELAGPAIDGFTGWADRVDQPWARSLGHRCRALVTGAERDYRRALDLESRPFERARTELLYGEWLRRARRKAEARTLLERALTVFDGLAAAPWAARARAELAASGVPVADRPDRPADRAVATLTPQELQIARLAARGRSNKDIAAQLFLSPKTVAYHLYKAYPKLGVTSRTELATLPL
ncbi:LuxR C-terminal-related transcriptional regulator [Plantactinospora siamensis]|uniref:LuxR C-terminal-related transcriptional regulator n=1 Tax=Plantactinospora siamensis TaxID=555372 RepID=A0ABV6NT53_9ACTN